MFFEICLAKVVSFLSSVFNFGSGSTWPGHLILSFDNKIIEKILQKNPQLKIILIAGTNGKTTTTSMLKYILEKLDKKVFSNQEGANLVNGIASILLKKADWRGRLDYDFALFETDEFSFPLIINKVSPDAILLLNLFRDQLDRYGEVNIIGKRWFSALRLQQKNYLLIVNGDDPYLFYNASLLKQKKIFFGVKKELMKTKQLADDVDFTYCPNCHSLLQYSNIAYAHLGNFYCPTCQFKRSGEIEDFSQERIMYPLEGFYNFYNTHAVLALIKALFAVKKDFNLLLQGFKTPFGRQEEIIYQARKFFLLLAKNPAGFNQALKTLTLILKEQKANIFIILNNRIPDGMDVSWIWDVDFRLIFKNAKRFYLAGDRVYDLALRLKYEGVEDIACKIFPDFKVAVKELINNTQPEEKIFVLPTYSAMLELRKVLLGRKFL